MLHIMRTPAEILYANETLADAVTLAHESQFQSWPVCEDSRLLGVLTKATLENALREGRFEDRVEHLLKDRFFPHLHPDQSLHLALERMGQSGIDVMPVVSRADLHKMEGVVWLQDILDFYKIGRTVSS